MDILLPISVLDTKNTTPPFNFFCMRHTGSRNFVRQAIHIGLFLAASLSWIHWSQPMLKHGRLNFLATERIIRLWELDTVDVSCPIAGNQGWSPPPSVALQCSSRWAELGSCDPPNPRSSRTVHIEYNFSVQRLFIPKTYHQQELQTSEILAKSYNTSSIARVLHPSSLTQSLPGRGMKARKWQNVQRWYISTIYPKNPKKSCPNT